MRIDKSVLNTMNKQTVINIIRRNGPIHRAEISRMSGLSIPTIMKITDEFIENGLIRENGKAKSTGGKPPLLLEFIADAYYIIGVDVGTTNTIVILMDLSAKIINRSVVATCTSRKSDIIIRRVIDTIEKVFSQSEVELSKILGIGIGIPGLIDKEQGVVKFSPDLGWENVDLVGPISEKFNLPIMIDNVTRAMAVGERSFGVALGVSNFICINLGYGIGAALFIDGEIYSGSSDSAGEFGHMTMEKDGPLCDCGNHGCLEALASANAISKEARQKIKNGHQSLITEMVEGDLEKIEAKTIYDAAKKGDELALEIVGRATEHIGIAVASIINLFDPDMVILAGGVVAAGSILTDAISRKSDSRKMKFAGGNTSIVTSQLGANAAAVGAASFILRRFTAAGGRMI